MTKQIIIVTGASSGFGALTARQLALAGHTVYAGMRATTGRNAPQVEAVAAYAAEHGVDLRAIELDVQSDASVEVGIAQIITECGRLDVVIHNAGHMSFGPAEAFTPEQFADLYDINVLSTQRVNRAALPQLRKQGKGLVLWVSSSSARGGTPPYLSPYFAAKARWTAWRSAMPASCLGGAWKPRSSCRGPSPAAPTTSLTAASPPMKHAPQNMPMALAPTSLTGP